ncbi:MAG: hypothetical protein RR922_05210 [Clostridia bacterium]
MTRRQFKRILLALIIISVIVMGMFALSNFVVMEKATTSYPLFNQNITNKKDANFVTKKLREFLLQVKNCDVNIDFKNVYEDTIVAEVTKKDYLARLNNAENKPYIDIMKKYLNIELAHVYLENAEATIDDETKAVGTTYGAIIAIDYLDLEANYKVFKNRQLLNEIDANMEFLTYISNEANVMVSKKYVNDYKIKYNKTAKILKFSAPLEIIQYQTQTKSAGETIPQKLAAIAYNISSEPFAENDALFKQAKIYADKELADVQNKNYDELAKNLTDRYSKNATTKATEYLNKFYNVYQYCDLVKFVEQESTIKFIGYDNVKKSLVYEIEEYPYEDVVDLFFLTDTSTTIAEATKCATKFDSFKDIVAHKEVKKTKRTIELAVGEESKLEATLLQQYMPNEKLLWNKDELEFSGITSIAPKRLVSDYDKFFKVEQLSGFASNAATVHIIRESYREDFKATGNWKKYDDAVLETYTGALKIILDYEKGTYNSYYKEKCDELFAAIQKDLDAKEEITLELSSKNSSLMGVYIKITKKEDLFSMVVKCDNWETPVE